MSILKIKDSQGNWVGVPTVKGDTGNGISSTILNDDYTLTLTFTDGTTYKTPSIRGEKGEKGESAIDMEIHICSASEYDAETRIPTIANPNDKTFYLVPIEDGTSPDLFTEWVYVNGAWEMFGSASVDLTDYVKNTDIGTTSKGGVFKVAADASIKAGSDSSVVVPTGNQHKSVFYGLAKASGDTTQSQSSNPVGTYTDEAKSSIQNMLDIPSNADLDEVKENVEQNTEDLLKAFPVETASGSIASFEDGANGIPLQSLVVDINPVQDLHGYDSPWPAGGGKNKIPFPYLTTSGTVDGITYTIDEDGKITANGTTERGTNFYFVRNMTLTAGTYTASIIGDITGLTFKVYDPVNRVSLCDVLPAEPKHWKTFTIESDTIVNIYLNTGQTGVMVNISAYFQLELGSTATDYAPYENICPISGWTEVNVNHSDADMTNPTTITIDLGQTVYGSKLDVLTGKLVVDRAMVDLGTLNWISEESVREGMFRVPTADVLPLGAVYRQIPICSIFKGAGVRGYSNIAYNEIAFSNSEIQPFIRIRSTSLVGMTEQQVKTFLENQFMCYELATPIEIQLTPHEVNSLLGQNNIWADTGNAHVEYRADPELYIKKTKPVVNVDDVQINGTSIVTDGVANVPVDTSLAIAGAVADAKATGDAVNELKNELKVKGMSAVGAERGNVPVADGNESWEWSGDINELQATINRLNVLIGSADLLTWNQRMGYVRDGYGAEMFPVGTRFSTLHDVLGNIQWDVVDHDHFQIPSDRQAHTMTLMTRFIIPRPFNPTILNYQCAIFAAKTNILPAGNYKFTASCHLSATANNGKVFYFTTSEDLPIGGQIRPYQWELGGSLVGTDIFAAYESPISTEPMFTIDVTNVALDDAVDLADITDGMYQYSGYCEAGAFDYSDTDLREWLNSDQKAGAWRTLKTLLHHVPYSNAYERRAQTDWFEDTDGFVRGFGSDFLDVVKEVEYPCVAQAMSVTHESVESYSVIDRFIIPSAAELGLSNGPLVGNALKFFEGADYTKRIKYQNANSRNGSAYPTRSVIGNVGRYGAGIRYFNTVGSDAIYLPATLQLVIMCTLG